MTVTTTALMQDRVALVTGASRGFGAAIARLLCRHGATVGGPHPRRAEARNRTSM